MRQEGSGSGAGENQPEGELMEVSYGTNVGRTLEHYKEIPMSKMHYGQALAMLVLIEGLEEHAE